MTTTAAKPPHNHTLPIVCIGNVRWKDECQAGRRGSAREDREGIQGQSFASTAKVSLAVPMAGTAVAPEPAGSN
ncbi:hypothetical protein G6F61_014849 [Rhizopus arrhizus]|nr:hypothetical protein G6F24_018567 [Rhizopus arrhizus]KAG1343337.1 hypothetical protein G6F61_014849 [Rhizopus arrhizus]